MYFVFALSSIVINAKLAMSQSSDSGHAIDVSDSSTVGVTQNATSGQKPLTKGEVALIAIAAVVALFIILLIVLLAVFISVRSKRRRTKGDNSSEGDGKSKSTTKTKADKKAKLEREKAAEIMQKQVWMQQLQVLQYDQMRQKPNATLLGLLQDKANVLNFIDLKRETARLISVRPQMRRSDQQSIRSVREMNDRKDMVDYVMSIADVKLEALEEKKGATEPIRGCRLEKIPIRTDSEVKLRKFDHIRGKKSGHMTLEEFDKDGWAYYFEDGKDDDGYKPVARIHMNKMCDYYGKTVILCQAPVAGQFESQWRAIYEQRVGVVVWIGALKELGKSKIDPYIPLKEGGRVVCGKFHVQTMFVQKFKDEFDVYRVVFGPDPNTHWACNGGEVTLEKLTREIYFIHVHFWPDHRIPDEPAQLADLVAQVQGRELTQEKNELPALLCHCSVGVQRSPAFLAVYIGRQMWIANRRANVLGIMRYIRRNRWKAFGYGDPFARGQIIFDVLRVVAMRSELEGVGDLNVTPHEQRVFDHEARTKDRAKDESFLDKTKVIG